MREAVVEKLEQAITRSHSDQLGARQLG